MNLDDLKREVARVDWFHTIDLGHGIITPGQIDPAQTLAQMDLLKDLSGKTVLDIGASDGFYSFEAERRGAARVVATSLWGKGGYRTKEGFDLARKALGSTVESIETDLFDLRPEDCGTFDVVLFLGVLYHLRHPLLGLERVFGVSRDLLILETHVDLVEIDVPAMRFYPGTELNRDATNWWGPNVSAVEAMLKTVGFGTVRLISSPNREKPRHPKLTALKAALGGEPPREGHLCGRAIFHAWRQGSGGP